MSAPCSTSDDPDIQTSSPTFLHTPASLEYAVTHVFFPLQHPEKNQCHPRKDYSLLRAVCSAAHAFETHIYEASEQAHWHHILKMLDNLQVALGSDDEDFVSQLQDMQTGDVRAFLIQRHNAGVIVTRLEGCILCETFEASPSKDTIKKMPEPLVCSYPRSAVQIPNTVFDKRNFRSKLASFMTELYWTDLDTHLPHPSDSRYTHMLVQGILQDICRADDDAQVAELAADLSNRNPIDDLRRITKRVRHGVGGRWYWHRSPLWLLIRVAIQIMIHRSLPVVSYKQFMLFFVCILARDKSNTQLHNDLLHLMSSNILRRLGKLETHAPGWLSELARKTCIHLGHILDNRREQPHALPSLFRNPSEHELARDTKLSLPHSSEYIRSVLANPTPKSVDNSFHPNHRRRGTIKDFLSSDGSFFDEAYGADRNVTLYDVERSVEQGIDDWAARIMDVNEACTQLDILMDKYPGKYIIQEGEAKDLEPLSIISLTRVELFVALDKLVVKEIPLLADYSPELPLAFLESLYLRKTTSLHRLSRAYQYLSMRHSQSHPGWSVLSDEFTEDSFPIRYYDQSPQLQELRARIERDTMDPAAGLAGMMPTSALHAKVVVFELQCPPCVRLWRSAVARLLVTFVVYPENVEKKQEGHPLLSVATLRPYLAQGPPDRIQLHLETPNATSLCYVVHHEGHLSTWQSARKHMSARKHIEDFDPVGQIPTRFPPRDQVFLSPHTSNDVLAAQADCPADFSLDEFATFGHLRNSGSLLWFNILHGLRSRTLNLRSRRIHEFLTRTAFEVGPLDPDTGVWICHQELEDSCFCNALLDELDSLFVDVAVRSIDAMMMSTMSLLLTRILASSPSEGISDRVVGLLCSIRRKTFQWMQELLYDLIEAPMNYERRSLLEKMAVACRSTFDVDTSILRKLFRFPEDVDTAISCAFFLRTTSSMWMGSDGNFGPLLRGDGLLSFALEEVLGDIILADPSDYGLDLAIGRMFICHRPGPQRWKQLQHPNTRWLACRTEPTLQFPSQTVQINILNGDLRVGGQSLPDIQWETTQSGLDISDQGFYIVPSTLPGMDFMIFGMVSKHKVHFSLQDGQMVVRVQCNEGNDVLALIPSEKLWGDIPSALMHDHVHWLNLTTKTIEVRPLSQPWEESLENWRIDCLPGQYHAYKGNETLVDIHSWTWAMVSDCFNCLIGTDKGISNYNRHLQRQFEKLLVTTSCTNSVHVQQLLVTLPHHSLSFFVNEQAELESHDFKHMVYDENQSIDTLFGLDSLLVLRPKACIAGTMVPTALIPRCILIPTGCPTSNHIFHQVFIDTTEGWHEPSYYMYDVDTDLGHLRGNGDLMSTRHLAYLHVMTSSSYPDPLTGKFGTDVALSLLQSGGCQSIMKPRAFDNNEIWTETAHDQINAAYKNIINKYYWVNDGYCPGDDLYTTSQAASFPSHALFNHPAPELPSCIMLPCVDQNTPSEDVTLLAQLSSVLQADTLFQQDYLAHLHGSAQSIYQGSQVAYKVASENLLKALQTHYVQCRINYLHSLEILKRTISSKNKSQTPEVDQPGQQSLITADVLLQYLASASPIKIPPEWKKCLISFALLLLDLQRARRLLRLALDGLKEELAKELENEGCNGWNPEEYPDWLLIQIEGNFLIRRAQAETAKEMMSPKSGENTVLQVNMGEGKSSVIVPIVAAALANGKQLVRVIVPKALTMQMFDLLVARLGGLVNRPVYHLPFSRTDCEGSLEVDDLQKLMSRCMSERGILLAQPEHVVSIKLMAVDKQISSERVGVAPTTRTRSPIYGYTLTSWSKLLKSMHPDTHIGNLLRLPWKSPNQSSEKGATQADHCSDSDMDTHASSKATKWLHLQKWLHSHVRDILDESDEILHPRFQLLYSIGTHQHMDGYPERWTIIQQILRLVRQHIHSLSMTSPDTIQYEACRPGSFPRVHVLRGFNSGRLVSLITQDVIAGRLPNFDFRYIRPEMQGAIRAFISDEHVYQIPETVRRVEEYARHSEQGQLWKGLLLLRGLLTSNVLFFALAERRWRVDYGLVPLQEEIFIQIVEEPPRRMLAVPYRAKDVPAPNTEFGHPDLTIILTCLSYYYGGLTEDQLRVSFERLLDEDNPSKEYAVWIEECKSSMPASLQRLSDMNLKSSEQWDKTIFPLFHRNQGAIDFYLSRVVFPKEAKEFPWKLAGSSWDLAERRENLITGFSGTNDGRWLLPMSIAQHDLDHQQGSNARVLTLLLRPENDSYMVAHNSEKRWITPRFLQLLAEQFPKIRVLLDVGSQVLDLSNRKVATTWLEICSDAVGAIYFNEQDDLVALPRNGKPIPFQSSPLSQHLDHCVVYLDHPHTRGTDLRLPAGTRAAVTLGPKVTKDTLVQGCMRMRKLGRGHSIMFFAPPEVDTSIRALAGKKDQTVRVTTVDVCCWAINETWTDIQERAPYWAQQGMNHKLRHVSWTRFSIGELTAEQLTDAWVQPAAKSLANLYAPSDVKELQSDLSTLDPEIRQHCKRLGVLSLPSAQMDEEQEREVNRERECEREVELPPRAEPAEHFLHPDVMSFIKTGIIPLLHSGSAFVPVFTTLERSSAATRDADVWSPSILATADFCRTIKPESTQGTIDQYLRPVQWILTRRNALGQVLVLLSPFEVERLLPDIRASECVYLHLYAPRTSERMKQSDDLRLYTIPALLSDWTTPWDLIDQLNVFAGQLYLRDYASYLRLSRFLGIPTEEAPNGPTMRRNLFNVPGSLEEVEMTFSGSPLPCVMALLAIRTRGRSFAHTHMGRILQGQVLREKDFERPGSGLSAHITHNEVPSSMDYDPRGHLHYPNRTREVLRRFNGASRLEVEPPRQCRSQS